MTLLPWNRKFWQFLVLETLTQIAVWGNLTKSPRKGCWTNFVVMKIWNFQNSYFQEHEWLFLNVPENKYFQVLFSENCTKMKIFIKDYFSKCDQIRRKLRIWSHLLKKYLMEIFIFCAVKNVLFVTSRLRRAEPAFEKDRDHFPNKFWKEQNVLQDSQENICTRVYKRLIKRKTFIKRS